MYGDEINMSEKQEKKKQGNKAVIALFILGFALSLFVGWVLFPKILYKTKKQPIDFNHAIHIDEVDDSCNSCHFFREDGTFSGIPKLTQCIDCHEEVIGENTEEEKFVNEYVKKEKEVPWLSYSKQPNCVFFSHIVHTKKAEMKCETCHGNIGTSEHSKEYKENRITGYSIDIWGRKIAGFAGKYSESSKMDDCARCHKEKTGSQGSCFQCHK